MEKQFEVRCRGIILDNDELLVVEHAGKEGFLALPGGHLEWGEDVKTALARELIEELGVTPVIGPLLYIHTFTQTNGVQPMEFFFKIENTSDFRTLGSEPSHAHELRAVHWVTRADQRMLRPVGVWHDFMAGRLGADGLQYLVNGRHT